MNAMETPQVWIYAIATTDLTTKQVEIFGIDEQPIQWVSIDSLQIAVSPDIGNTAAIGFEHTFLEYESVLCKLCSTRDYLPVRFGTKMPMHQVPEILGKQAKRFHEQLEAFSGCCEISVRWVIPIQILDQPSTSDLTSTSKSTTAQSGTSYLVRRREQSRIASAAERLASETGAKLRDLYPAAIRKVLSTARKLDSRSMPCVMQPSTESEVSDFSDLIVIELALLVLKSDAGRIKSFLHSQHIHGQAPTLISGPWPLYSFVGQ